MKIDPNPEAMKNMWGPEIKWPIRRKVSRSFKSAARKLIPAESRKNGGD